MATLNVKSDIYERLARMAAARNTTVENLIEPVLDQLAEADQSSETRRKAFDAWMLLVHQRDQVYPPGFEANDSRESIYEGRGE